MLSIVRAGPPSMAKLSYLRSGGRGGVEEGGRGGVEEQRSDTKAVVVVGGGSVAEG
jgi:hypothetical protein